MFKQFKQQLVPVHLFCNGQTRPPPSHNNDENIFKNIDTWSILISDISISTCSLLFVVFPWKKAKNLQNSTAFLSIRETNRTWLRLLQTFVGKNAREELWILTTLSFSFRRSLSSSSSWLIFDLEFLRFSWSWTTSLRRFDAARSRSWISVWFK